MATSIANYHKGPWLFFKFFNPAFMIKWQYGSNHRNIHTSQCLQKDRSKDRALVQHLHYRDHEKTMRHRNLPIVELPDYSYADGRPTEVASCQKQRKEKNYALAKQVVKLVGEMRFAQEQLVSQQNEETKRQQQRLASRLKEKSQDP